MRPATSAGCSARRLRERRARGAGAGASSRARRGAEGGAAARSSRPTCSSRETLGPALEGVDVAYYLVHSMGRGSDGDFAERDHAGRRELRRAPPPRPGSSGSSTSAGWGRGPSTSTAATRRPRPCATASVPVTYFRAAAVIGAGSESFRTVFYLVAPPAGDGHPALGRRPAPSRSRSPTPSPISPPPPTSSLPRRPRDPDRRPRRHHLRRHDRRARPRPRAAGRRCRITVPLLTPCALLALDRAGDARRRRRRAAADRGPRDRDRSSPIHRGMELVPRTSSGTPLRQRPAARRAAESAA